MTAKTKATTPSSIVGPLTESEWVAQTCAAMLQKEPSNAMRKEYRTLLALRPELSKYGDLATQYRRTALTSYATHPALAEDVQHRLTLLRESLAASSATPLELLLIDVVLAAYQDYWSFAVVYKQRTATEFTLRDMEQWEKIVASKEARFVRAVVELAKVRRLLNLPAPQVNINLPGGQQVNMQGTR